MNFEKLYWLVKPDCYRNLNNILGAVFDNEDIQFFIKEHPKGVYVTYESQIVSDRHKWGSMPYPEYNKNITEYYSILYSSEDWLKENDYEYSGIISRKEKLEKIKKLNG